MHAINLIARAIRSENVELKMPDISAEEAACAIIGERCLCLPRAKLLSKSFTNLDLLAAPGSPYVGLDAYISLTHKWERMSSWYCDGERFIRLDRKGVRDMVITGTYGTHWAAYATTSYKKHGSLFARVNTGAAAVWRFEMKDADCTDRAKMMGIWDRLNAELRFGMGRSIMESLTCPPFVLKKIGAHRWMAFERWARPLYHGALYQFICYLLPSQEELKNERA